MQALNIYNSQKKHEVDIFSLARPCPAYGQLVQQEHNTRGSSPWQSVNNASNNPSPSGDQSFRNAQNRSSKSNDILFACKSNVFNLMRLLQDMGIPPVN
mmetsp:Transcript_23083/g.29561  ORF Transcript_23083/g.29561 Transcript_23083/m.29561 type:complete len:99 (-) Transcript_23083:647-943(-)